MEWIMNNTELFARGNLINQTIKMNSLHVEVKKNEKFLPPLIQLQRCGSSSVNMKHQAKSVAMHKCCDLHINIYNGPLSDQQLIKAALVRHC